MTNLGTNACRERWPHMSVEFGTDEPDAKETETADVLAELHGLLEDFAPPWYTEHLHEQTEKALKTLGRL